MISTSQFVLTSAALDLPEHLVHGNEHREELRVLPNNLVAQLVVAASVNFVTDRHGSEALERNHLRVVLEELFEELKGDRTLSEWIHEAPSVLGVERMGHDALVMRVIADTRPSKVMDVERLLRERITRRLVERGIKVPVTPATPVPPAV